MAFLLAGGAAGVTAQPPVPTPAQAAYAKAASRNVEERFIAEVAGVVGLGHARVRAAMPEERRITAVGTRLIAALEQDLGRALSEEQKRAILDADERRKAALSAVNAHLPGR
ncbi:hypothetical protein E6C76_13350 [Pseudothauera nasutitermitis]|uniref:Uncharacterized protein n=1 Tax=Pseudothauera nasutitermitis TaxID=2565930 RepID=A0A4S4AVM6_9RHOO|nr:hypothetical protein E6C76_13350 [Pseudothauera nasutitermitis]